MSDYKYDATGASFVYFFFILLASIMLAYTYLVFLRKREGFSARHSKNGYQLCACTACSTTLKEKFKKRSPPGSRINLGVIFLICGWSAVGYLLYMIVIAPSLEQSHIFDPYKILGVDENMSMANIAEVRKKLVYEWHPDKAVSRGVSLKVAEERFTAINRAWETLKNPEARRNWEEWGDPDGRPTFTSGIALPKWLVEDKNKHIVLGGYVLVVMVLTPIFIKRWWAKLKKISSIGTLSNASISILVRNIGSTLDPATIISKISTLPDFSEAISHGTPLHPGVQKLAAELGKELALRGYNTKVLPPLVSERNFTPYLVNIYIYCYLLGIKSEVGEINEDIMSVIEMVDRVINVSVSIVSSKYNLKLLTAFLKLEQAFSQAVYFDAPSIMQLPHVSADLYVRKKDKKGLPLNISDYYRLTDEEIDSKLPPTWTKENRDEFKLVLDSMPSVRIDKVTFRVDGEDGVTAESHVSAELTLIMDTVGDRRKNTSSTAPPRANILPHSPKHPTRDTCFWFCILTSPKYSNIYYIRKLQPTIGSVTLQMFFDSPKEPASIPLSIDIISDTYMGCDCSRSFTITSVAPKPLEVPLPPRGKSARRKKYDTSTHTKADSQNKSDADLEDSSSSEYDSTDSDMSDIS